MNTSIPGKLNLHATKDDLALIIKITVRAASLMSLESLGNDRLTTTMDLSACHLNGCKLDLEALLAADDGDFVHDVSGIIRHIDRRTGGLTDCFMPRYAAREVR